ncbi:YopX family protein [Virgibacillus sp. LDC1]|nr:YopX family protein [Virgibacillus sp. LDC1]
MKLRVFYKPLKQMLEPDQIESINFDTKMLGVYMEMDGKGYHKLRMSDFEIMWFTGRFDKRRKDIFGGDFLRGDGFGDTKQEIRIVCYDSRQARYKAVPLSLYKANAGNGGWTGFDIKGDGEVIGNIYDNPDLLEGGYE